MNLDNNTKTLTDLMLDTNPDYSPEINDAINMHNSSIVAFSQGVTVSSLLTLLINKNIISEEEFANEMNRQIGLSDQHNVIMSNREILLSCIEQDAEYMAELKSVHESLAERDGEQINMFDDGDGAKILDIFQPNDNSNESNESADDEPVVIDAE